MNKWYIGYDALGSYVVFESDKEPEKLSIYGYICNGATYMGYYGPFADEHEAVLYMEVNELG